MSSIMDRVVELSKQYKEMTESKLQTRDITQEFVLRSKIRDLHNACKVIFFLLTWLKKSVIMGKLRRRNSIRFHFMLQEWDQLSDQQKEIEAKLQELEASPPR